MVQCEQQSLELEQQSIKQTVDKFVSKSVALFYENKSILVTGATGFIGKVLIEKLLYSCQDLDKIYLLIRGAKNKTPQERLNEMVLKKPFDFRLKPEFILSKLVAVDSDLAQPDLGLSEKAREMLINNVAVVFHVAASVKFDATIEANMKQNVCATKGVLDLAVNFKKLESFVHVSTAYSNCQLKHIDERIYTMAVPEDPMSMVVTEEMIDGRPNTYTYTKAVAENVVCDYADKMNIAIARPSIVMPAQHEPVLGWTDSLNGPVGLSLLGALGILQKLPYNTEVIFDMIPVDIVSNGLIAIGWQTAQEANLNKLDEDNSTKPEKSNTCALNGSVKVYNLTTSSDNPCTFYQYFTEGRKILSKTPSVRALRPLVSIPKQKGVNPVNYWLHQIFSHLLFAYIIDTLLSVAGHKKLAVKAVKRMHEANTMFKFFTTNQWSFQTSNVAKLRENLSPDDRKTFNFDVKTINWASYVGNCWLGSRRYLMKEDDSNINYARKRYLILCTIYYAIKLLLIVSITTIVRQVFTSAAIKSMLLVPTYGVIYLL